MFHDFLSKSLPVILLANCHLDDMVLQLSDAFNTFLTDVSDLENQTLNFQYGKIEKLKF